MVAQSPEECGGASVPADPIVMQSSAPQKIPQELTTVLSATKNTTGPDSASTATQTKQENLKRTFVPLSSLVVKSKSLTSIVKSKSLSSIVRNIRRDSNTYYPDPNRRDDAPTSRLTAKNDVRMGSEVPTQIASTEVSPTSKKSMISFKSDENKMNASTPIVSAEGHVQMPRTSRTSFLRPIGLAGRDDLENAAFDAGLDKDIGLKLALPDKLDIMRGKATPQIEGRDDSDNGQQKKIIVVNQDNSLRAFTKKFPIPTMALAPKGVSSTKGSEQVTDCPVRTTSDPNLEENVMRTSEMDPSTHQVTLPSSSDLLMSGRVGSLLENYDRLLRHQASKGRKWFDFTELVGADRSQLHETYLKSIGYNEPEMEERKKVVGLHSCAPSTTNVTPDGIVPCNPFASPKSSSGESFIGGSVDMIDMRSANEGKNPAIKTKNIPHPSILRNLLDCSDDIVVEGYFTETVGEDIEGLANPPSDNPQGQALYGADRAEAGAVSVAILSSQRHRRFIVCYKGTEEQQAKPCCSRVQQTNADGKPSMLHPTHAVHVNPTFRDSYFTSNLEKDIFDVLDRLTSAEPFCDVVYTGHSFGGALALIGATRYAALFPMMAVHCHAFGAPKVGGTTFRHFANSLPNLKIIRVENGSDYFPTYPLGPKWDHPGHAIVLNEQQEADISNLAKDVLAKVYASSNPLSALAFIHKEQSSVSAYKFDKRVNGDAKHPSFNLFGMTFDEHTIKKARAIDPFARSKKEKGKIDHEMRSYLNGLEQFTHLGLPWVLAYAGEEGSGIVRGSEEEPRHLV